MYGYSRGVELRLAHIKKYFKGEFNIEQYITQYLRHQAGGTQPHADHTDETGRYAVEFEKKYGYAP